MARVDKVRVETPGGRREVIRVRRSFATIINGQPWLAAPSYRGSLVGVRHNHRGLA